jgi:hypothetical protein
MTFLTDFADQAVVLPVVMAIAIFLAAMGWRRGALVWLGVVGTTLGAILVLKLGFGACRPVFGPWQLRSASGHAAAASVVVGGVVTLLSGRWWIALAASLVAAVAIGTSRLELGVHSVPEVIIGGAVGMIGTACLAALIGRRPLTRRVPLVAIGVMVALLVHGVHLPAEAAIEWMSNGLLDFVPACRGNWTPSRRTGELPGPPRQVMRSRPAVAVLDPHDVVFPQVCARLHLDQRQRNQAGVFQAVHAAQRQINTLVLT